MKKDKSLPPPPYPGTHLPDIKQRQSDDRCSQTLILPDGRTLSFAEYGSTTPPEKTTLRTAKTIFYLHGIVCSRLEAALFHQAAANLGARIIGIDRPGIGLSSPYPKGRRHRICFWKRSPPQLTDWPDYVRQLARHLGLTEGYCVLGGGIGGVYALSCAHALRHEEGLRGVGVLSSMWPWELGMDGMHRAMQITMDMMVRVPEKATRMLDMHAVPTMTGPDEEARRAAVEASLDLFPARDRRIFKRNGGEMEGVFLDTVREAYRQGSAGAVESVTMFAAPWGFGLEDVGFEGVKLFYAADDPNMPVEMGCYYAKRLPNAVIKEFHGETSLSVVADRGEEILRILLEEKS